MKRKKRRACCCSPSNNGSSISNCSSEENCHHHGPEHKKPTYNTKMHILSVFDELESYLAPYTPEIRRVRIPPLAAAAEGDRKGGEDLRNGNGFGSSNNVAKDGFTVNPETRELSPGRGERGGELFRNGNGGFCCSDSVADDGSSKNPKSCDNAAESVETANCGGGLSEGWDQLKLCPEGLKEPSQDFVEGLEKLLEMKFGIMALRIRHGLDAWTLGSHMVNPFEVLSYVAAASTLNRAYFKMWELIQTFQLVPSVSEQQRFLSAHLCEGPGGFIEAVLEYRARSSNISEEGNQNPLEEAVDEETNARDSPHGLDDGTRLRRDSSGSDNHSAAPSRFITLNNGNEDLSCRSTVSDISGAVNNCSKNHSSTRFNDGSNTSSPKAGSGSPGIAAETSRSVQVGENQLSMSGGCSRANQLLNNCSRASTNSSSAVGNRLHEFDIHIDTAPLPRGQNEAAVRGENLAEPNLRSFGSTSSIHYHDLWFGLTLAASTQQCAAGGSPPPVMEMTKLNEKLGAGNGNSQGHLNFGMDGSGDITEPANVNAFVEYTLSRTDGQRMDLITADGAFDVSEDFSSQEHSHVHLLFCELVAGLMLQAEGGSFVLKIFDCYTSSTLTMLFILSSLYKNVEIVRLRTTRICNSERYVVAGGFLGLNPKHETILLRLNEEWSIASLRGEKVGLFLAGGLPKQLLQVVMESNADISAVQIDGINRALQLANVIGERLPRADSFGKRKGSISMLRRKLQTQKRMQRNAISLCKALNIPRRSQFCSE